MLITYKHILLAKAANSKESSKPHNRMYHDQRGLPGVSVFCVCVSGGCT